MQYSNPNIESSYQENNLGKNLYDAIIEHKPNVIIDFGVLFGYSTVAMAMAVDELVKESGGEYTGKIIVYDLFEKYPHKHATKQEFIDTIASYSLSNYVEIKEMDFTEWIKNPEDFDFMHLDISNKGDTIETLYNAVRNQLKNGAIVYFEGGTEERDNVEWMIKYNQKKIAGCGAPYKVINPKFPGISQLLVD